MSDKYPNRRSVLKSGAALASLGLVGSLSGCSSVPFVGGNGGNSNANQRINKVPAGSTFVVHVNLGAMLSDDVVRQRVNELIQREAGNSGGPQSIDEAFSQAESQAGFDPSDVSEMMAFGSAESNTAGTILWTGWDKEQVTSTLTENGMTESSYGGKTVYAPEMSMGGASSIALLDDTTYAFGTQQSIEAIIDTWTGEASSVSGDVETAFTSAQGGYVQFGFDVPADQLQQGGGQTGGMNLQAINNIQYGYGSVTDADNGREMVLKLQASDEESARGIRGLIDIGLGSAKQQLQRAAQQPGADTEDVQQFQSALENLETNRNGQTVTVRNKDGIDFAIGALAVAATFALGFGASAGGGSVSGRTAPQANFSLDYSGGRLTITHAAGDHIAADRLYISDDSGSVRTWLSLGGSASGTVDGRPAVTAGDSVELTGVDSDYQLRLIWQDGDSSAVLLRAQGPAA
jgi:hypothetical protein